MGRSTSPVRRRADRAKNTSSFMNYYTSNYARLRALCEKNKGTVANTVISGYAANEWRLLSEEERKQYSMTDVSFFNEPSAPAPTPAPAPAPEPAPEPAGSKSSATEGKPKTTSGRAKKQDAPKTPDDKGNEVTFIPV